MSYTIRIPITAAIFHENALTISLKHDMEDFWVNLGPFVGWGRFSNRERIWPPREEVLIPLNVKLDPETTELLAKSSPVKEHVFLLVEVIPADSPPPSPRGCGSDVLWRKREALESIARQSAYLRGLDDSL